VALKNTLRVRLDRNHRLIWIQKVGNTSEKGGKKWKDEME